MIALEMAGVVVFLAGMIAARRLLTPRYMRGFAGALLLLWAAVIAYTALIVRVPSAEAQINFQLLPRGNEMNFYQNIVVFVPLGVLLAEAIPALGALLPACSGLAASFVIEFVQMTTHRGVCDVNDLMANALGALGGVAVYLALRRAAEWMARR